MVCDDGYHRAVYRKERKRKRRNQWQRAQGKINNQWVIKKGKPVRGSSRCDDKSKSVGIQGR